MNDCKNKSMKVKEILFENICIEIINTKGQVIENLNTPNMKITVDVSKIPNGIYIIKAKTDEAITMKKFIKQ